GRPVYRPAERAAPPGPSKGPITALKTMHRPSGVQLGSVAPAQGLAQGRGTMCSPRPVAPTMPTTAGPPLGGSRSNTTWEPSGEMTALISTVFGPGWVSTRSPLPSGRADTNRARWELAVEDLRPHDPASMPPVR